MNLYSQNNNIDDVKIKGVVELQIINTKTNEIVDSLHIENTATILSQIYAGYFYDIANLILINEDITKYYPPNYDIRHVKKTISLTNYIFDYASNFQKNKISNTLYEFSFTYTPNKETTIYALSLVFNFDNALRPFTILILPQPVTVNQEYAITGKYRLYLDKVPYTFSFRTDTYAYENTNTLFRDEAIDPDYILWYLKNRTFIKNPSVDVWYGYDTTPIQSSGKVQVEINPDLYNYLYNKYRQTIDDDIEIKKNIVKNAFLFINANTDRKITKIYPSFKVKFKNTSDSNNLQYDLFFNQISYSTLDVWPIATSRFTTFDAELEKYLWNIDTSLMVKKYNYDSIDWKDFLSQDLFFGSTINRPKNSNWIDTYKIPYSIYKDCIWTNSVIIDYYGLNTERKFILMNRIDTTNTRIYKPNGSYDTFTSGNYKTISPNISDYLLTIDEYLNIVLSINPNAKNYPYPFDNLRNIYSGIYITNDDWIHINSIDKDKGINKIILRSGDYYTSNGTYKTLPSNTNGYLYDPFTLQITNLDNNTVLENVAYIRDLARIFRKEYYVENIVDLPSYDKSKLTPGVRVFNGDLYHSGIIDTEIEFKFKFTTTLLPYFFNKMFKLTFIDNISPSFVKDEYASFAIGAFMPIDLLQRLDINVYRNIPFKIIIDKNDQKLPKTYSIQIPNIVKYKTLEIPEIESTYNNIVPYPIHFEHPDYIIKLRGESFASVDFNSFFFEIHYKDFDIDFDKLILLNHVIVMKSYNTNEIYPLRTKIIGYDRINKIIRLFPLLYRFYRSNSPSYISQLELTLYLYDNNITSSATRFTDFINHSSILNAYRPLIVTPSEIINVRNI